MNEDVQQFLENLLAISARSEYVFRGEPAHYENVSSGLYRMLAGASPSSADRIIEVEQGIVAALKSYANLSERSDDAALSELQHYGGKTNLIDFSRDCLVALFFACGTPLDQDGRVIFLRRESTEYDIVSPVGNHSRVIAQKSVFVKSPTGVIVPSDDDIVNVPSEMKSALLAYLSRAHGVSHQSIYTDIIGFIDYQELGCVDISFQPDERCRDLQKAQVCIGELIIAREYSAELLRLVEQTLYQVALLVYVLIIRILHLPIGFRRYYSRCATLCDVLAQRIRIISLIRYDSLALHILYQRLSLLDVVFLPRCQDEPQRIAQRVNTCMHLRAEPAPASA